MKHHNPHRLLALIAITVAVALSASASAWAGSYKVQSCWPGGVGDGPWMLAGNIFVRGCIPDSDAGIVLRAQVGSGAGPTLPGSYGRATFEGPPGTRMRALDGELRLHQQGGWAAGIVTHGATRWALGGPGCVIACEFPMPNVIHVDVDSSDVGITAYCPSGGGNCATYNAVDGYPNGVELRRISVTLEDLWPPAVRVADGQWLRGSGELPVSAQDNAGIVRARSIVDGQGQASREFRCDYTMRVPCPSGQLAVPVEADALGDGSHALVVEVTDAGGNVARASGSVGLDRVAPGEPRRLSVVGGEGWHAANAFTWQWQNPPQPDRAPIAAAHYRICPAGSEKGCVTGEARGANLTEIHDVKVPRPGAWEASVWLRDAAGNENGESTPEPVMLRWDDTEPSAVIAPTDPDDPTRVRVHATDDLSGVAAGELWLRRQSRKPKAWHTIPVGLESGGFSGRLDDERLRRGVYELRAHAVNGAGRERSTDRRSNGRPATVEIPLRIATRLRAGRARRVPVRGSRRTVYRTRPVIRDGRRVRLHGRLTAPGGNPLADATITVYVRRGLRGAQWRPAAVLHASQTGRFHYIVPAGPNRTVRFRYGGAAKIRPATQDVQVRVRARSTLAASRHRAVNGDPIRFRGRIVGRPLPPEGKRIELQWLARGTWRTIASARANARTGRWGYTYRFTATRRTTRYRFRVAIPRESGWPYITGTSRHVRVTVKGNAG